MGPQCMILLLWIYTMTSLSQSLSTHPPIVVFDPTIESHQKYRSRLTDQHSSDSHNRIVSSITHPPPQINRKTDNLDKINPAYLVEYESLKLPVRETQQDYKKFNESHPKKLVLRYSDNPSPGVNHNDSVSEKNVYISPEFPGNSHNYPMINPVTSPVPIQKGQKYKNYLELNRSGGHGENNNKVYKSGYNGNPVVNPYIQHVNPVGRNLNGNVDNYGDTRQQIDDIDSETSPGEFGDDIIEGKVRRLDDGGGGDVEHVEAAGSEKKEEHQPKKHSEKHEEGEGVEVHEDHHEAGGEDEEKGYESHHEHEKGDKGHHDKEDHDKHYDEEEGKVKKHSDDSDYYKHYDSGEKGGKESEFEEEGRFNKGHSTKGNHVVHKKDEYEKLEEFYDESHEEDGHEEDGAYHHKYEKENGGSEKSGHYDAGEEEEKHGKKGEHEKGHHYNEKKGYDHREGEDKHHKKGDKYGKKGGHKNGKKWSYKE